MEQKIQENASITLNQLKIKLWMEFQINVCINTVKNWLDRELFTVKLTRNQIDNMNNAKNEEKRGTYMQKLFEARSEGRTLIWIDETNFNLFCRRRQGRSKIGTRASILLPASKVAYLHCIGAMSASNIVSVSTHRSSFKSDACIEWFNNLIEECNRQAVENPTFIIDNAPVHNRLQSILEQDPHVQILSLAPYF